MRDVFTCFVYHYGRFLETTCLYSLCYAIGRLAMHCSFRFGITHVVGVSGCVLSSLTSLYMDLVFAVHGLAMLLA